MPQETGNVEEGNSPPGQPRPDNKRDQQPRYPGGPGEGRGALNSEPVRCPPG